MRALIFTAESVRQILAGSKTQTRRRTWTTESFNGLLNVHRLEAVDGDVLTWTTVTSGRSVIDAGTAWVTGESRTVFDLNRPEPLKLTGWSESRSTVEAGDERGDLLVRCEVATDG